MIEAQQESIKNLLNLIQENPDLRIIPLVDTECVPGDDFNSWVAGWGKSQIEEVWENPNKDRIYIKSEDYDVLLDETVDLGIETDEEARKHVDGYPWEKVIIVRITTP